MTLDRASGTELLSEARRTLLETIVPSLPAHLRYDGLMIANAMAIAMREITDGSAAIEAVLGASIGLYDDAASAQNDAETHDSTFVRLERRLANDIRVGVFDAPGPTRNQVRQALRAITAARLRLSNPKALAEAPQDKKK